MPPEKYLWRAGRQIQEFPYLSRIGVSLIIETVAVKAQKNLRRKIRLE